MCVSQIPIKIKSLCLQKNISIARLLTDCELSKSFIYDLEKRSKAPSSITLARIADYLDCSVDYLLGRTDVVEVNKGYYYPEEIAAYGAEGTKGEFTTPQKEIT